ncbi:replication initiation protein [Haematobacter massiliensis]|uniref:plasmid replication protein RepC n=2 Tax=Haematobacter massiliensis TaxID=195105 RepID=UPI000A01F620|nr:plasmid replication protein RepC [Haematobacter massiliensis]OWJ71228.1 replication initiation protein [Haematobacter massiliensis]OWJ84233.1 replication initiation protein [Haematobacter massiliensis]QBJ25769.1 replication initiation protein [Haematobacter massiliensis]
MKHISITPFGRPITADLMAARALARGSAEAKAVPKWEPLRDLTVARKAFSLSDRDLSVLQALISFVGDDVIFPEGCIVFPSNATLSHRAHGMPESTLRRHIAALVAAGVILRHDSPNGKRYATRTSDAHPARAFGFDLGPLARRAAEIRGVADQCREADQHLQLLRETVVLKLRDALQLAHLDLEELIEMKKALRRKLSHAELEQMSERLGEVLLTNETEETSGNDDQNERHIQENHIIKNKRNRSAIAVKLTDVMKACTEFSSFYSVNDWPAFVEAAEQLRPMLGIDASAWLKAREVMSPECAATTIACILQKLRNIRHPSAYLRVLTDRARRGAFSLERMVHGLSPRLAPTG